MLDGIAGVKNDAGKIVLMCGACKVFPQDVYGAQNKADLTYMMICPKCKKTLGEWATTAERDAELRAFAKKVLQS